MPTDFQLSAEARNVQLVQALLAALAAGVTQGAAARELGISPATASRLLERHRAGLPLAPRTTEAGRKPLATLTPEEQAAVQRLTLQTDPHDPAKTQRVSVSFALRIYARSEACRPELAEAILRPRSSKHTITPTLRRQARVRQSDRLLAAGEDTFHLHGICTPRALSWLDETGAEQPLVPGLLMEADDMTANEPCWIPWDDPADPCAARWGCRLVRPQMLPWLDVGSASFRSYGLVLRYNDAYRASDILRGVAHLFHSTGAPRYLRLEYGTWDAHAVNALESVHGLCRILRATSAKTKFIENRFHTLQKFLALGGVSMGRHRGVKETETSQWLAARTGRLDPRTVFPSLEQWVARVDAAFAACNAEPIEGEVYGPASARRLHGRRAWVPDEIWHTWLEAHPEAVRTPTLEQTYRLLPEQREVAIRGGHVALKVAEHDATFYFFHEAFARLGDGYRVRVCCDPARPDLGAAVLSAESGARAAFRLDTEAGRGGTEATERRPYREGELVCVAEHVERVPQFSATSEWDDRASFERRARYREQCRLQYRQIMPFGRGTGLRSTEHRDGRGNVARVDLGGRAAAAMPSAECQVPNGQSTERRGQRPVVPLLRPGEEMLCVDAPRVRVEAEREPEPAEVLEC